MKNTFLSNPNLNEFVSLINNK